MFCMKCGTQLPEEARFCIKCGNAVQMIPAEPAVNKPVQTVVPAAAQPMKTEYGTVFDTADGLPFELQTPVYRQMPQPQSQPQQQWQSQPQPQPQPQQQWQSQPQPQPQPQPQQQWQSQPQPQQQWQSQPQPQPQPVRQEPPAVKDYSDGAFSNRTTAPGSVIAETPNVMFFLPYATHKNYFKAISNCTVTLYADRLTVQSAHLLGPGINECIMLKDIGSLEEYKALTNKGMDVHLRSGGNILLYYQTDSFGKKKAQEAVQTMMYEINRRSGR